MIRHEMRVECKEDDERVLDTLDIHPAISHAHYTTSTSKLLLVFSPLVSTVSASGKPVVRDEREMEQSLYR